MLIEKIIIENFRQYVGKHEILFSTDRNRNVTLLIGDNGTGKTTISQAFLWCLYGETPGFLKKESLLSQIVENEMHNGWNRDVCVTIELEHSNIHYKISRRRAFYKEGEKIKSNNSYLDITTKKNGDTIPLSRKEAEKRIEEILPKELSIYFFLTGEKIDSMSFDIKMGKSKDFANAVNTLLDLNYFRTILRHLRSIKREYDSSDFSGMSEEIERMNREIENDVNNLETFNNTVKELEKSINYFDEKIADLKSILRSKESSKDIEMERQKYENRIKDKKGNQTIEINTALSQFIKKAPFYFAKESFFSALKTLKEVSNIKAEDIPEKLHADLITWIENNHKCICGTEVNEGTSIFDYLEQWRNIVPPEAIGTLIKKEKSDIIKNNRSSEDLYKILYRRQETLESIHDEIEEFNEKINELTEKLSNASDTSSIQAELANSQEQKQNGEDKLRIYNIQIEKIKTNIYDCKRNRERLLKDSEEGRRIIAYKSMTDKLIYGFEQKLEEEEKQKRECLIESVKEAFKSIYGTSFSITIDENYKISTDSDLEKSTGQGMSVIYAFLAGLLNVIKSEKSKTIEKPLEQTEDDDENLILDSYPLVLDAPFSALDKTRISSICDILPKVSEQIIILIKDTDGIEAKKYLEKKLGCCYRLTKVGEKDNNTIIEKMEEV